MIRQRRVNPDLPTEDWEDWYVVKENPMPWEVGPLGIGRAGGKLRPYIGPSPQLQAYQKSVRQALLDQNPVKREGEVEVKFYIWRRLDEYKTKAGRKASAHAADATNIQKATEDAIQGILIGNDRYVLAPSSVIMDQNPELEGMVIIRVRPVQNHEDEIPPLVWDKISGIADTPPDTVPSASPINPTDWF